MIRLAVAVLVGLAAGPALAHRLGPCLDRDEFLARLAERYGEQPIGFGLTPDGRVLEVVVSHQSGSWTIIVTSPDGVACGLAAGEAWGLRGRSPAPDAPIPPPA